MNLERATDTENKGLEKGKSSTPELELKMIRQDHDYHLRQLMAPKRSTEMFCDFLQSKEIIPSTRSVLDLACGMGGVIVYMSSRWPDIEYVGVDADDNLVREGNRAFEKLGLKARLFRGNIYQIDEMYPQGKFDGIIITQTIFALPDPDLALQRMIALKPKWIGLTSLLYDGQVSCTIQFTQHYDLQRGAKSEHQYRIYSMAEFADFFKKHGFGQVTSVPFEIDIDLPKPDHSMMGTYTERLVDGRRLQISGPLLMPWRFVLVTP